ncbi:FKBP-type peptidyl-prolyl cis-trans isomerase [Gilliamella intestini]|uniref:Peptidyl-prolyl cis-trans isomerase n=1 Tax=Gilliamella intestini TaxID=1798183 RepID=A0A1C4AFG7_9GAMM|nr:FKBP-type peptidyl-prolyl cis-trans isomerase [Gilliamella intestini]SCB93231.1 FKBP-type peptidyl-prolyl cis-trans isomerase FkpA [Gilliamella intestini]
MKSLIKMTLVSSAIVLALAGCDNKNSPNKVTISTDAQKEAYALGSSFATYMRSDLEQSEIKTDEEYLISGFNETFHGSSQLSKDEVKTILYAFNKRMQEESKDRFEKEKNENTKSGNKFRTQFAKKDGVKQTKSGLLYQIIQEGSDRHPTAQDTVIVHYTGTLTDGRKFDSSYDRSEPATFPLSTVIKGWAEGIQLIGVGGKIKLVVPPDLAFGDQSFPGQEGKARIEPASTLVFEVELLGIDGDKNDTNEAPREEPASEPEQAE